MKRLFYRLMPTVIVSTVFLLSCDRLGDASSAGKGKLYLSFVKGGELFTRSNLNLPDTSDFLLTVSDEAGSILYKGKYGDCPECMDVNPGSYNVRVISSEFTVPSFDTPQFGDEQCVVVPADGAGRVMLMCRQMNAGMRLKISSEFLTQCPGSVLLLKSSAGKLMYSYSEKRIAYFHPGPVSLIMSTGGIDEVIMVKNLEAREIITVGVSVPLSSQMAGSGISVDVDTTRIWINDECLIGDEDSGDEVEDALSISEARQSAGRNKVWVSGYIVGGDLTSASASFEIPFKSRTNLLIGSRSVTSDREACMSVQLPDGELRDALNLVDNPGLLGRRICVRGDIVQAYYGLPGIKGTMEYQIL